MSVADACAKVFAGDLTAGHIPIVCGRYPVELALNRSAVDNAQERDSVAQGEGEQLARHGGLRPA